MLFLNKQEEATKLYGGRMEKVTFKPVGTCSTLIEFEHDEKDRIHNLRFEGGCKGNLIAIGRLCEGMKAERIATLLTGISCGERNTSCGDQLAKAVMYKSKEA